MNKFGGKRLGGFHGNLSVLYDGRVIGQVAVTKRTRRKILGRFIPGPDFDVCRAEFEEAVRWFSQWEGTGLIPEMDYVAWNRWIEVIGRITTHIQLPDVAQRIEEFAVDNTLGVEITLYD
ncbi:MAG TPA: hypothetical protein VMF69_18845 [Gemmataceae bacterium]|nr:hypothetical protein [Gemmataceae bacterium]